VKKKERIKFCENIINKKIRGNQIFFTDETKIDLSPFLNDSIRLSLNNQEKLKQGKEEAFQLIMIPGGIHFHDFSHLFVLEGTMNEFSYAHALLFYKENLEELKKNNIIKKIFFEWDGATPHMSFNNKKLIKNLFGENLIQNPLNSPDLAYPIETLRALLKKNVKKRMPKDLQELQKFTIEEWNKIPDDYPKKLVKNYLKRNKEKRESKRSKKGISKKYKNSKVRNVRLKKKKEREELDEKIKDLKEMTLIDYLQHIRDQKETKLIWDKRYHTKT